MANRRDAEMTNRHVENGLRMLCGIGLVLAMVAGRVSAEEKTVASSVGWQSAIVVI